MTSRPLTQPRVLVLHGPSLNLLGEREPEIYGSTTLAELDAQLIELGAALDVSVACRQHNIEGELVEAIHSARAGFSGIVINPAAYTHTSVAVADAIRAVGLPTVEVHLSNLFTREPLRHRSLSGAACEGVIMGFGTESYALALRSIAARLHGGSG